MAVVAACCAALSVSAGAAPVPAAGAAAGRVDDTSQPRAASDLRASRNPAPASSASAASPSRSRSTSARWRVPSRGLPASAAWPSADRFHTVTSAVAGAPVRIAAGTAAANTSPGGWW